MKDYRLYKHTRVEVELNDAIERAKKLDAFLRSVSYKRYDDKNRPTR